MRVLSWEFGSIILFLFFIWYTYNQNEKILEQDSKIYILEDTIVMQHEAIQKQKFLISLLSYSYNENPARTFD